MSRRSLLSWLLVFFLVVLYVPTIREIDRGWSSHPYAGHSVFVPALGALILWTRRHRLRDHLEPAPRAGLGMIGFALGLAAVGHAYQSVVAHIASVILVAVGVALWFRGVEWMRQAGAAFIFLLFMLPLPRGVVAAVTLPVQHFVARFSSGLLDLFSVPVFQDGLLIYLKTMSLRVDESCNGLRFLMVMLVVTTAFALMYVPTRTRRLIVIGAAVPAAVLANVVRVTTIAAAAHFLGADVSFEALHDYTGKIVWVLAIASILGFGVLLGWTGRAASAAPRGAGAYVTLK